MATIGILDVACDDASALQRQLNELYEYEKDIPTKICHRSRIALFQSMLAELIADGSIKQFGKALDIGCNAGFYSKLISDAGFQEVLGFDLNPMFVQRANRAFGSDKPGKRIAFETRDATRPGKSEQYDFILCTEVIEHTSKPGEVIQSILSMLARGGVAIVSLPNCISIGYLTAYAAALLKRGEISPELRDHMSYPFFKGPRLFKKYGASVLLSSGVNCLFNDRALGLLAHTPVFHALNALNFSLSKRWPCKYFSQFFFFALRNGT